MGKRLCDMVTIAENTEACVLLMVKPEVEPIDLIRLGGFMGNEKMFRVDKDDRTVSLTIFREGEKPLSISMGAANTTGPAEALKARNLVMEAVNLDFGIFTGNNSTMRGGDFEWHMKTTCGPRDLDSLRLFTMVESFSGMCNFYVNGQHIANVMKNDLDEWLAERNIKMIKYGQLPIDDMFETAAVNGELTREFIDIENGEPFFTLKFTREDIEGHLEHLGVPVTPENLSRAAKVVTNAIKSRVGEWSWELINDALYPERETIFDYESPFENAEAVSQDKARRNADAPAPERDKGAR